MVQTLKAHCHFCVLMMKAHDSLSKVGREYDERHLNVNFPCMFVELEHVFDEHQATLGVHQYR